MYAYVYMDVYMQAYMYMNVYMYMYMYVYMDVYMQAYMYMNVLEYMCVCVCVCVRQDRVTSLLFYESVILNFNTSKKKMCGEIKISLKVNSWAIIKVSIILTMVCNYCHLFLHA